MAETKPAPKPAATQESVDALTKLVVKIAEALSIK
jgi:hypothetical protein